MRLIVRVVSLLVPLVLLAACTSDDDARDGAGGNSQPEAGLDASTDGARTDLGDAATMGDAAMDAATGDAAASPDAGGGTCVTELHCTQGCFYEPREIDPDTDCNGEGAYVYEGTCGAYRYRSQGDGFVGGTSYYRIDTGELVATRGYLDEGGLCDRRDVFDVIEGDATVVEACEVPSNSPENLCCFTARAYYITFCEAADAGP